MVITVTVRIDTNEPDGPVIREQTARLAAGRDTLAAAVSAAGSTPTPPGAFHVPTKPTPKKPGDPTGQPILDALIAEVTADDTVIESATTLINGIAGEITTAVNAAIAGGATPAQLAPLTALTTGLNTAATALAAAVAANTPAAPPVSP